MRRKQCQVHLCHAQKHTIMVCSKTNEANIIIKMLLAHYLYLHRHRSGGIAMVGYCTYVNEIFVISFISPHMQRQIIQCLIYMRVSLLISCLYEWIAIYWAWLLWPPMDIWSVNRSIHARLIIKYDLHFNAHWMHVVQYTSLESFKSSTILIDFNGRHIHVKDVQYLVGYV